MKRLKRDKEETKIEVKKPFKAPRRCKKCNCPLIHNYFYCTVCLSDFDAYRTDENWIYGEL